MYATVKESRIIPDEELDGKVILLCFDEGFFIPGRGTSLYYDVFDEG